MKKVVIGVVLLAAVLALGAFVNLRPPAFSQDAKQALDDFIQRFEGAGFSYAIVSAQKSSASDMENVDNLDDFSGLGGGSRPAGICPGGQLIKESWCVTIDKAVETPEGSSFHFIVQKQNQLWFVEGALDSQVFQQFGCRNW